MNFTEKNKRFCQEYVLMKSNTEAIFNAVCNYFNIDRDTILGASRKREIVESRHIFQYLLYKHTRLSLRGIAKITGKRDSSTAFYAIKKINNLMDVYSSIREDIKIIEKELEL